MYHFMNIRFNSFLALAIIFLLPLVTEAQEFDIKVTVNAPNVKKVDPRIFGELQNQLNNLVNNQRWSDQTYQDFEKIRGSLSLTITKEINETNFEGDLFIQSERPVYGSSYSTPILNHRDKISFQFDPNSQIKYSENSFDGNLTSIIAYYLNVFLAYDHDSFMLYGGDIFWQKASDVIRVLPQHQQSSKGWSSQKKTNNRYYLLESMQNPSVRPLRKAMYEYHRLGLDVMQENVAQGRQKIREALEKLREVQKAYPNSMALVVFLNAKSEEITSVFMPESRTIKRDLYNLLAELAPANTHKFADLKR